MKRLIKNVRLVKDACSKAIQDGMIVYEGNVITYAGKRTDVVSNEYDQIIDGNGCIAIPGLV
ncbi:MAG TPA: N-ethylammeline chlorohydrolase, partial [Clostridiales bacterium]|nr:N-ethylammeline chlorohydrolase [Clostridiales bacterium]